MSPVPMLCRVYVSLGFWGFATASQIAGWSGLVRLPSARPFLARHRLRDQKSRAPSNCHGLRHEGFAALNAILVSTKQVSPLALDAGREIARNLASWMPAPDRDRRCFVRCAVTRAEPTLHWLRVPTCGP